MGHRRPVTRSGGVEDKATREVETIYSSSCKYVDRQSKARYVWEKYSSLLDHTVLDVGADAMYLKPYVEGAGGRYLGIGHGEGIDHPMDLEGGILPFGDRSFETVLCLDVLEHLEAAHAIYDEILRVACRNVIISLPNPWHSFFRFLASRGHSRESALKYYGLPETCPEDRHRWFFGESEARTFLRKNGERAGFDVVQADSLGDESPMGGRGIKGVVGRFVLRRIFRSDITELGLHHGTVWCVLKRREL